MVRDAEVLKRFRSKDQCPLQPAEKQKQKCCWVLKGSDGLFYGGRSKGFVCAVPLDRAKRFSSWDVANEFLKDLGMVYWFLVPVGCV